MDDQHFALAGLRPDDLGGYYLTEDQGATVGVFPINGRLRHLIPFAEVDKSIEYLGERHGRMTAVTVVDDGEVRRVARHLSARLRRGRLARRVLRSGGREPRGSGGPPFADVVDAGPATGRVYLPTASSPEMGRVGAADRGGA